MDREGETTDTTLTLTLNYEDATDERWDETCREAINTSQHMA